MPESHPFKPFIPTPCYTLILGSFPGKESTQQKRKDDWYYDATRNQFWKIIEKVYSCDLRDTKSKQSLFTIFGIGISNIIKSCDRKENKNTDANLINISFNSKTINNILKENKIQKILFTSQWVKKKFTSHIEPDIEKKDYKKIILPSPSPAFRRMTLKQKAEIYKKELPKLLLLRERFYAAEGFSVIKKEGKNSSYRSL